jgi:hypothetical protein
MAMTEEARAERVIAALEARDPDVDGSLRLPWHDDVRSFPVVELELDAVVLNPNSHRIQAQLESHPQADLIRSDPFTDEAQELIAEILREQIPGFDALRDNLAEDTQRQPGVVSPVGLLVNANRRAVALRDNGAHYIRVAVLPPASGDEISDLELSLQVQIDFRQDYTFTNRLLFVDELVNLQNRDIDEVARALNVAASTSERELEKGRSKVNQDTRVLALIRELQRRGAGQPNLTTFDKQEIAFEELDASYQDTFEEDPVGAAGMREARLLGILADVPYRDLRRFDAEALGTYLIPWLEDDDLFGEVLPALAPIQVEAEEEEPEGLDILEGEEAGEDEGPEMSDLERITALVDLFAGTAGEAEITLPTEEGERTEEREKTCEVLKDTLRAAAVEITDDRRHDNRLERPLNRALEAERKVRSSHEAFERVADNDEFDPEPLREALGSVRERLDTLLTALDGSS